MTQANERVMKGALVLSLVATVSAQCTLNDDDDGWSNSSQTNATSVNCRVGTQRDALVTFGVTFLIGLMDVEAMIATFDANKARCFLEHDRERLLAVVEAGFGDIYAFNQSVKALMQKPAKVRV